MSQENEKWTPESGQEVEVLDKHKGIWRKVRVTAVGEDCLLVRWETTETILAKSCSFRPIQTQADKLRDEQIAFLAVDVTPDDLGQFANAIQRRLGLID